jgi:hypothetical protein
MTFRANYSRTILGNRLGRKEGCTSSTIEIRFYAGDRCDVALKLKLSLWYRVAFDCVRCAGPILPLVSVRFNRPRPP